MMSGVAVVATSAQVLVPVLKANTPISEYGASVPVAVVKVGLNVIPSVSTGGSIGGGLFFLQADMKAVRTTIMLMESNRIFVFIMANV
jgi:hypothetical protein